MFQPSWGLQTWGLLVPAGVLAGSPRLAGHRAARLPTGIFCATLCPAPSAQSNSIASLGCVRESSSHALFCKMKRILLPT